MGISIGVLAFVVLGQWILIWRLLERLLLQAKIPLLGPVQILPQKVERPDPPSTKKKLFSIAIDQ